jgi:hypothetical protein
MRDRLRGCGNAVHTITAIYHTISLKKMQGLFEKKLKKYCFFAEIVYNIFITNPQGGIFLQ